MRSMGGRFQLSARALATPGMLGARLRDRAAERPLEDAVADQVRFFGGRAVVVEGVARELVGHASDRR